MLSVRLRAVIVATLALGVAIQIGALVWAAAHPASRAMQSEDMVPFTYLQATIASVLAAVMAMAGSVLILSLTLGTSVQRSHLGSILLSDEEFRLAVTGAIVTIFACLLSLLSAHAALVSHSPVSIFLLSVGALVEFSADVVALARLFRRIPRLLTQETLLETSLARLNSEYLVSQERRLLGDGSTDRGRSDVLHDLIFSYRVYPVEADDPLVTVHDVLENVLSQSPASVAATSLALVARRFSELSGEPHDAIYQLLVTPWLAELRVAVVRRGSPSIALAYFDVWADVLEEARGRGMKLFFAHAARPFVTSLEEVARAGLFEGAGGRVLKPLMRALMAAGHEPAALGPWAGALVAWMRQDAEKGDGTFTRVLWNPVETVLERFLDDVDREIPLVDVLVHGLSGVVRAAARAGIETSGGSSFALKLARRLRRAQLELEARLSGGGLSPTAAARARRRIALLGEPVAVLAALSATRPELAEAAGLPTATSVVEDDRDGEA